MNECLNLPEPENIALYIYSKYRDEFKCTSIRKKKWFVKKEDKWKEIDDGYILYTRISNEILKDFQGLLLELEEKSLKIRKKNSSQNLCDINHNLDEIISNISVCKKICNLLKNTTFKNKIMKESAILFFDEDFI
jgi:hypothetical protein